MNILKGKTYKTVNGGSVRIVADDRVSTNGKHWVGLYDGDKGEWVLTYDNDGNAYVFGTMKPELCIVPEKRKWWVISYKNDDDHILAEIWSAHVNSFESIMKRIKSHRYNEAIVTLVEQEQ